VCGFSLVTVDAEIGMAIFAFLACENALAMVPCDLLQAVAYAKDRDVEIEDSGVYVRGIVCVDGVRTAGEDDTFRTP